MAKLRPLKTFKELPDHGTRKRYLRGCRCVSCTRANTDYHQRYRGPNRDAIGALPAEFDKLNPAYSGTRQDSSTVRHGDPAMYNSRGCRCELCKEGWKTYQAERRRITAWRKTLADRASNTFQPIRLHPNSEMAGFYMPQSWPAYDNGDPALPNPLPVNFTDHLMSELNYISDSADEPLNAEGHLSLARMLLYNATAEKPRGYFPPHIGTFLGGVDWLTGLHIPSIPNTLRFQIIDEAYPDTHTYPEPTPTREYQALSTYGSVYFLTTYMQQITLLSELATTLNEIGEPLTPVQHLRKHFELYATPGTAPLAQAGIPEIERVLPTSFLLPNEDSYPQPLSDYPYPFDLYDCSPVAYYPANAAYPNPSQGRIVHNPAYNPPPEGVPTNASSFPVAAPGYLNINPRDPLNRGY